jgi:hypothetical protein
MDKGFGIHATRDRTLRLLYLCLAASERGSRGPPAKLSCYSYILRLLYLGWQWKELPVEIDRRGRPEIHYTRIYYGFPGWQANGCSDAIFEGSVFPLAQDDRLDISGIHGDGTTSTWDVVSIGRPQEAQKNM